MSQDNYAGQLRQKGSDLVSDLKEIGGVLKEATSDKLHSIKDAASERLTAIKDGASCMGRNTRDAVNGAVSRSPWTSMFVAAGVGAGAGFAAAWFFRRKSPVNGDARNS
ncbi:MAG: hypothetical protein FD180_3301 [Planctomycetota bacterium]|nr:MAG: hypothetical protein FD180_3301 [Planctomycetota bacterium]